MHLLQFHVKICMPGEQGQPFELSALFWTILQSVMSELFMGLFGIANIVDTKSEPVQEDSECQRIAYISKIGE